MNMRQCAQCGRNYKVPDACPHCAPELWNPGEARTTRLSTAVSTTLGGAYIGVALGGGLIGMLLGGATG